MPAVKKSSAQGSKPGKAPVCEWFPLKPSVARGLNATGQLTVFCSRGAHNNDPRHPIQDSFMKALIDRAIPCLDIVIPVTKEMVLERIYIYVPIGNTKKNEYWNYLYKTRDELCSFIMTLEARMLALKLAKIPPTAYSVPLSDFGWNVLLTVHPPLSGHWKTAERRAITGEGVNILEEKSMMPDHIGYKLAAAECSKANSRAKTKAGWVSATGTDRNHHHGKPYNLARPINTIHNKSRAVRSDAQFAKAWAREFTRSYRSPSVESDITMRTASPPPEEHSDEQYADADETSGTISVLPDTQNAETPDLDPKVKDEDKDQVPHRSSTSLSAQDETQDAEVAIHLESTTDTDVPAAHSEPSVAESTGEETLCEADLSDSEDVDDPTIVSSASKDENSETHTDEELEINEPAANTNDTPASPSITNTATPTPNNTPFAPFTFLAFDPASFEEANESDFAPKAAVNYKKQLDRDAKLWLAKHGHKKGFLFDMR